MISVINTQDELFKDYNLDDNEIVIKNLSRVNIFIGENNSGKSRFLRGIFSIERFEYKIYNVDLTGIINSLENYKDEIENLFSRFPEIKKVEKHDLFEKTKLNGYLNNNFHLKFNEVLEIINRLSSKRFGETVKELVLNTTSTNFNYFEQQIFQISQQYYGILKNSFQSSNFDEIKFVRNYVPILRGLRPNNSSDGGKHPNMESIRLNFNETDTYLNRTVRDYFFNEKTKTVGSYVHNVYTGLGFYSDIKKQLLSTKNNRKKIKDFEDFIWKTFFPQKKEFTLIPEDDKDTLLVGFGDGNEERPIYDLGDGIQALILLLYPIFMKQGENALFFIEEPELNLHPGMQRVFLETLLDNRFKDMQFFFTTHSNHFLDLTLETDNISVYHFNKTTEGKFEVKNTVHGDVNILKSLGIRNSSVFLANCSIWVEGITDRKYIRKYLELYWQEHKKEDKKPHIEDLHYAFVEYAGSNIVHWNFDENNEDENINALKVSNNIFLILDSDVNKDGIISKEERHQKLKVALGDNLYITEGKEIENSLSIDIIKKVVADYEKVDLIDLKFKKTSIEVENTKSHNSNSIMEKPYYWKDNIGKLIDNSLKERKRKTTYAKDNSVNDKDAFCDKVIKHLEKYEDLSEEAKDIAKRVVEFIGSCNK